MKTKSLSILMAVILLSGALLSCHTEKLDYKAGKYLFAYSDGNIYKYNTETGFGSALCSDPLCSHNTKSCPFYGVGEDVFQYGDRIIFFKDSQLMQYDLISSKISVLNNAPGIIYRPFVYENYIFFNSVSFDFSQDAENNMTIDLFRYDLDIGTLLQLNDDNLYDLQVVEGVKNGRMIWYDDGLQSMYSTDMDYCNKVLFNEDFYGITAGYQSYRLEVSNTTPLSFNLFNIVEGRKNIVLYDIVSVKGYGDNLLFTYNNEQGRYIGKAKNENNDIVEIFDYQSNDIYISDEYGNNKKILCTLPSDYIIFSLAPTKKTLSSGMIIGVQLKEYEFDDSGFIIGYKASKSIAMVDIETGMVRISEVR